MTVICFDSESVQVLRERKGPAIGIFCGEREQGMKLSQQAKGTSIYWAGPEGHNSAACKQLQVKNLPWQTVLLDSEVLSAGPMSAKSTTLEGKCREQELLIRTLELKVRALTKEVETYQQLFRRYAPVLPELRRSLPAESSPLPSALELDYWESGNGEDHRTTLRLEDIGNRGLWIVQKKQVHKPFATQSIFPSNRKVSEPSSPIKPIFHDKASVRHREERQSPIDSGQYTQKRRWPDVHRRSKSVLES
jgi:hypothetical protein